MLKSECKNSEHLIDLEKHDDRVYYVYKIKRYTNEHTLFIEIRILKEKFEFYSNLITIAKEEYFENKEELK
jgi:hypothetical protein